MTENGKKWLTRKEAAEFLANLGYPIAPKTLANLATTKNRGKGPPFRRVIGIKSVQYDPDRLIEWAQKSTVEVP